MKKLLSILILALLSVTTVASAASIDEQWRMQRGDNRTTHKSIQINDGMMPLETYSYLWAETSLPNGNFSRYLCTNITDVNCSAPQVYTYQSILPKCKSNSDLDCIEGLSAISASGLKSSGVFKQYNLEIHPNNFTGAEKLGITQNSNPSIWDIPEAPHAGGISYIVVAGAGGNKFLSDPTLPDQTIFAYVMPISIRKNALVDIARCRQAEASQNLSVSANTRCTGSDFEYTSATEVRCVAAFGTTGECLTPEKFPAGLSFELKLRLSREPLGWFHGRITDPEISVTPIGKSGVSISVKANPVQVPIFVSSGQWSDLSVATKEWWLNDFVNCSVDCGPAGGTHPDDPRIDLANSTVELSQYPYGNFAMNLIKKLAADVGDKAVAAPSVWSFKTLKNNPSSGADNCIVSGSGLKGIVTTNSTTYSQGAPEFKNGELSYKVASLHNLPDGSEFKGTYDLILSSEVARCLYKFSKAPISAKIEVVNESGVNQIATTTVKEKAGWLYLSAKNFTFSSPTVRVKLTQEVDKPVAAPSASSTTPVAAVNKTTIICVKGKTSKKVTAIKPVCPTGFKKK